MSGNTPNSYAQTEPSFSIPDSSRAKRAKTGSARAWEASGGHGFQSDQAGYLLVGHHALKLQHVRRVETDLHKRRRYTPPPENATLTPRRWEVDR